jgi:hypothetical protein
VKTIIIRLPAVEAAMMAELQRKKIIPRDIEVYLGNHIRSIYEQCNRKG